MAAISGVALLAEGVDRNLDEVSDLAADGWSPSSRRAWIEITSTTTPRRAITVALLAEGVDRNKRRSSSWLRWMASPSSRRAWIEIFWLNAFSSPWTSPSSRRAWIEISLVSSK